MRLKTTGLLACVVVGARLLAGLQPASAQESPSAKKVPERLTVAVLDFETKDRATADLGDKIADLLTVFLSTDEHLQLVERAKLQVILKEMELGASGIVSPEQATRIGGLVGAQVLVTGRGFVVNEKLYITAKAISVETSRMGAALATAPLSADLDVPVQELAAKLSSWLAENGDKMVATIGTPADQVDLLKKALKDKELPTVVAVVIETHVGPTTIDPAAETELVYLMRKVGIPVVSGRQIGIADWAMEYFRDANLPVPEAGRKADVAIVGEGFSEFAGRNGNLITVKARVELKAVDTRTQQVLAIARKTATQVDLAEQIAGKAALQKAAGEAAIELLPEAVGKWLELHPPKAGGQEAAAGENK
jgi:hypothetical protein